MSEVMPSVGVPPMPAEARGIPNDARLQIHLNQAIDYIKDHCQGVSRDKWRVALLAAEEIVRLREEIKPLRHRGPGAGIDGLF